jgi:hypothetical protein
MLGTSQIGAQNNESKSGDNNSTLLTYSNKREKYFDIISLVEN